MIASNFIKSAIASIMTLVAFGVFAAVAQAEDADKKCVDVGLSAHCDINFKWDQKQVEQTINNAGKCIGDACKAAGDNFNKWNEEQRQKAEEERRQRADEQRRQQAEDARRQQAEDARRQQADDRRNQQVDDRRDQRDQRSRDDR